MSERKTHFDNVTKTMDAIRKEVAGKRTVKAINLCHSDKFQGKGLNKNGSKRLKQELMDVSVSPPPLCSARLKKNDLYEWVSTIKGPPDSVYCGGVFHLDLDFPKEYPLKPPAVKFTTRIYHCNVNESGTICLDILGKSWISTMTVSSVLLSICSLLTDCNPNDALVGRIACLYLKDQNEHDRLARQYTKKFARPKIPSID